MISIIGAGPIGSYLGWLFAKRGEDVKIFEEHNQVGLPVQCAGLLTGKIEKLVRLNSEWVVNRVKAVKVISPNKNSVEIKLKKPEVVIDRQSFDQHLANKAVDAGAELHMGHRCEGIKDKIAIVRDKKDDKTRQFKSDYIIGADGVKSVVRKYLGLFKKQNLLMGLQARVKLEKDKDIYEVYLGSSFPGFLSWVIPESNNVVRIGMISDGRHVSDFKRWLKAHMSRGQKSNILDYQGGLVPVYDPGERTSKGHVFLVGDAACQIKNTTAGGIVPGLFAANALCDSILNNKDYEKEWRKKLGRELWIHYKLRRILDRFSDKDYNYLIELCKKDRVREILEGESREFPSRMMLRLILNKPRFLRFTKFLLKS